MKTRRLAVLVVLAVALPSASLAGQSEKQSDHNIVRDRELKWAPLIKGSEMAVVSGDPNKNGEPFVIRIRQVDGAKVPPHWHPADEYLTVLKGTFLIGMGETYDESKLQA